MWASSSTASGSSVPSALPPVVGLTTNAGGKPVTRVFGQPLDPESGNAPGALLKLIQYLQKRGAAFRSPPPFPTSPLFVLEHMLASTHLD